MCIHEGKSKQSLTTRLVLMTLCDFKVAQAPDNVDSPFMVTELTSSVMASSRKFSCINEEVVYRCVAQRTNNKTFFTQWTWDGTPIGKIFNSTNRIGHDTCNSPSGELNFLHLTLVSTMNDTCVSLLIVIPSLMQSNQTNTDVQVTCTTFGEGQMPPQHSQEITHTAISSESSLHVLKFMIIPCTPGNVNFDHIYR